MNGFDKKNENLNASILYLINLLKSLIKTSNQCQIFLTIKEMN